MFSGVVRVDERGATVRLAQCARERGELLDAEVGTQDTPTVS